MIENDNFCAEIVAYLNKKFTMPNVIKTELLRVVIEATENIKDGNFSPTNVE